MEWGVPTRIAVFEAAAAGVFALAAGIGALSGDRPAGAVAGVSALMLAGLAVRDRVVRVRLRADHDGLTVVQGFAGRRRLAWGDIVAIGVDQRSRRGRSARLLEIDTGEVVHLLSTRELGADPADVVLALDDLRP